MYVLKQSFQLTSPRQINGLYEVLSNYVRFSPMTTAKQSRQRHFPYQHPTFGRGKNKKADSAWKKTIYYVWWSYLKRNVEYLLTCNNGGKGSLSWLYADFGDVRGDDFKTWWSEGERGAKLFSEPPSQETIRVVSKDEVASLDEDLLLVSVPLNLPKKFLLQRFRKLLGESHEGKRGKQYAKKSKAKYQFTGQPNVEALLTALNIWDKRQEFPKMKLWELGQFLPLSKHLYKEYLKNGTPLGTAEKKIIEATVSRYIRKAAGSIRNAGHGQFP